MPRGALHPRQLHRPARSPGQARSDLDRQGLAPLRPSRRGTTSAATATSATRARSTCSLTELKLHFGARWQPRIPLWAWQDPRAQRVDTDAAWDGWRAPPHPLQARRLRRRWTRQGRASSSAARTARAPSQLSVSRALASGPPSTARAARQLLFSPAGSWGAIKAGVRAALERAGYCTADLAPKSLGELLEGGVEGRPVHCIVSLACGGIAEPREDGALEAALAARQSTPVLLANSAIPRRRHGRAKAAGAAATHLQRGRTRRHCTTNWCGVRKRWWRGCRPCSGPFARWLSRRGPMQAHLATR